LRALRIPSLLIQPLVENAVEHGVAPFAAGGAVHVSARRTDACTGSQLAIAVHDSGVGTSSAAWASGREYGVGLANIKQGLRCHFGDRASVNIETGRPTGTTVALTLPLDPMPVAVQELE